MKSVSSLMIFSFICAFAKLNAQTKKIAFESHSGSAENFNIALSNNFFETDDSNFGLLSHKNVYKIEKIIFISDSQSVLVSKVYDRPFDALNDSSDIFINKKVDTLTGSNMFNKKVPVDSLKKLLKYYDKYEINEKTKFINKGEKRSKQKISNNNTEDKSMQVVTFISNNNDAGNTPFSGSQWAFLITGILFFALIAGWITWRMYYLKRHQEIL